MRILLLKFTVKLELQYNHRKDISADYKHNDRQDARTEFNRRIGILLLPDISSNKENDNNYLYDHISDKCLLLLCPHLLSCLP